MRYFHTYIRRNTESIAISASLLPLSMPLHPTPFPLTFPLLHRKEIQGSQFYAFLWWHQLSSLLEEPTVWGIQSHLTSETGANFFVHLALNVFNLESNIPFQRFVSFWHTVQLLKKAVWLFEQTEAGQFQMHIKTVAETEKEKPWIAKQFNSNSRPKWVVTVINIQRACCHGDFGSLFSM